MALFSAKDKKTEQESGFHYIEREEPKAVFSIPERPTVRQQMEYFGAATGTPDNKYLIRLWFAARDLIHSWECESVPDFKVDIDKVTSPTTTEVLLWAGVQVRNYMSGLEDIPKN